jgi:hypothetical protein
MGTLKRRLLPFVAAGGLALGMAMPAMAAPVITGGLVNVTIVDAIDIDRVTVQLPIAVAANVCDVDVVVLAQMLADTGSADCDAVAGSRARNNN